MVAAAAALAATPAGAQEVEASVVALRHHVQCPARLAHYLVREVADTQLVALRLSY